MLIDVFTSFYLYFIQDTLAQQIDTKLKSMKRFSWISDSNWVCDRSNIESIFKSVYRFT